MSQKYSQEKVIPLARVSSSVENFRDKLLTNWKMKEWNWERNEPVFFLGMYHIGDYVRFLWHRGKKYVFWCGSDILNLRWYNRWIFKLRDAEHFCENDAEFGTLFQHGITSLMRPIFMDNSRKFRYNKRMGMRSAYMCAHEGREEEYGLIEFLRLAGKNPTKKFYVYGIKRSCDYLNVYFRGKLSNDEFNESIKEHDAFFRFNKFDGFSEATGKAILLGQKVYDVNYPSIDKNWFHRVVNKLPFQGG